MFSRIIVALIKLIINATRKVCAKNEGGISFFKIKQNNSFFLGGEIINPSSSYVNFYYNNIKIDSIQLDSQNKFFKKIEDIKPGIYRIEHVPENQNIIVENGDSLWIRVNVEDFRESLTFSGKGSSKNNFLSSGHPTHCAPPRPRRPFHPST